MDRKQMKVLSVVMVMLACTIVSGHFQVIRPGVDVVLPGEDRVLGLEILFTHPMAGGPVMQMEKPVRFGVLVDGKSEDLMGSLEERLVDGKRIYDSSYEVGQPGDHIFFIEPGAYWEPSERKMIVHYTKVVVNSMGEERGWDSMVGLPVEIEPLVRPYGLWTGNVFRGVVRRGDGRAVAFAEIEVEYLNDGTVDASGPGVTQVIKADVNGVFCYAMPRAGWWGFAALLDGKEQMVNPSGEMVDVELGGVMWVRCSDMVEVD